MDLLHAYSKQSLGSSAPATLTVKATQSRRPLTSPLSVKQQARQLRPDQVSSLVAHYLSIGSVAAAASALKVSRQTAAKHLHGAGVETVRRMTQTEIASAIQAYQDGQSAARIGRRLGFDPQTVLTALHRADIPVRPRPGR